VLHEFYRVAFRRKLYHSLEKLQTDLDGQLQLGKNASRKNEMPMNLRGLIAGLGNPGPEYIRTRHNFGFMLVDALLREAESKGFARMLSGKKDPYALWRVSFDESSGEWLLSTPLNFMNRSGDAVQRIAAYYHVPPEDILVLHDELDLPLGRMKLKKGGGNAGHNGLHSIQQMLGTPDFYRLRLGIGKTQDCDSSSYVLGRFSSDEQDTLDKTLGAAVQGVILFARKGERMAQQFCNSFFP
jgi:PTH1 family peptidyl-tRNA hydrolase